jgi:hypothetical protein
MHELDAEVAKRVPIRPHSFARKMRFVAANHEHQSDCGENGAGLTIDGGFTA